MGRAFSQFDLDTFNYLRPPPLRTEMWLEEQIRSAAVCISEHCHTPTFKIEIKHRRPTH